MAHNRALKRHRGVVAVRSLACMLILAQGTSGGYCKRNDPKPVDTTPGVSGGTMTSSVEEVPDVAGSYQLDLADLAPVGTTTLEETGSTESLRNPATVTAALAVIDAALQAPDAGDRYLAVDGLINLSWPLARPRLEAMLKDSDGQVVMLALQQLSHQVDPATQALLEPYREWDDLWRPNDKHGRAYRPREDFGSDATPIEALARMQDPAMEPFIREKLTAVDDVVANIQGIRLAEKFDASKFTEELATHFNGDPTQAAPYHAARTLFLAKINREQADRFLRKGLSPDNMLPSIIVTGMAKDLNRTDWEPELRGLLASPDPTVRGQALEALGLLDLPVSSDELNMVLSDFDARGRILQRVAEWADPATMIPLLEADTKPDDQDYFLVQLALARLGSKRAIDELLAKSRTRESNSSWTRESLVALNALAELDRPGVATELMSILDGEDPPVRAQYACLQGLGRLMDPASLPTLVRYARNYASSQPGLAAYAASIAATLADPAAVASQPSKKRMLWPVPEIGRLKDMYPSRTGAAATINPADPQPAIPEDEPITPLPPAEGAAQEGDAE